MYGFRIYLETNTKTDQNNITLARHKKKKKKNALYCKNVKNDHQTNTVTRCFIILLLSNPQTESCLRIILQLPMTVL